MSTARSRRSGAVALCFAIVSAAVLAGLVSGCAKTVVMPQSTTTQVDLSRKNYHVIRSNAVGASHGLSLLGLLPIVSPTYTSAMSDLYGTTGIQEGKAQALVNVNEESSTLYLLVFSVPTLTVRADIIEFTD